MVVQAAANEDSAAVASTTSIGTVVFAGGSLSSVTGISSPSSVGNTATSGGSFYQVDGVYSTSLVGAVPAVAIQPTTPSPNRKFLIAPAGSIVSISPSGRLASIQERQDTIKAA